MKNIRFTVVLVFSLCLLFSTANVYSQGFYGNAEGEEWVSGEENTDNSETLRAAAADEDDDFPELPGDPGAPVGEGILVLTGLCGAYLTKRIWKNRNDK